MSFVGHCYGYRFLNDGMLESSYIILQSHLVHMYISIVQETGSEDMACTLMQQIHGSMDSYQEIIMPKASTLDACVVKIHLANEFLILNPLAQH